MTGARGASVACPPCGGGHQHEYDDDRPFENDWVRDYLQKLGDRAREGDPCVWCDHSKCATCPPPRPADGDGSL